MLRRAVHHRGTLEAFDDERRTFIRQCCGVLREVAQVFGYEPYYVTLFYQAHSVSRFIRQKIMFNCWAIDMYRQSQTLIGTSLKATHDVPLFGTVKECLAGTAAASARYRVLINNAVVRAGAEIDSDKVCTLPKHTEIVVTETVTLGANTRVRFDQVCALGPALLEFRA